jgi:hypothetical protein
MKHLFKPDDIPKVMNDDPVKLFFIEQEKLAHENQVLLGS